MIVELKRSKVTGPDGLPQEFYQTCIDEIIPLLTLVFNQKVHSSFYHKVISLNNKKGYGYNLDNLRRVALMN